ncbi:MAG: hypothetical protein WD876_03750 [Candidatus Pacearchaeota archaeon]
MGSDRKRMKKLRKKRIKAIDEQIDEHEYKIRTEKGRKDTTKEYWKSEIEDKFEKQKKEDEEYLEEN